MILVLGGTSDSIKICVELQREKIDFILSVTTEYGKEIAKDYAQNLVVGKMDIKDMISLIKEKNIHVVVDATHPYAQEVSKNAMKACEKLNTNYLRYERPSSVILEGEHILKVDTLEEACDLANKIGKKIFLATGSKNLDYFVEHLKDKELIARVLPTSSVIQSCEGLNLNPENIIGMKGPFTYDMNKALYDFYQVDLVITKESGKEGGFLEKINAAKDLNIKTIVISRPKLEYINPCTNLEVLMNTIRRD